MILKKFKLILFGKFKNCEFDFAPITVFQGNNESGKSTLFDAIFDCVSSPRGNSTEGKRLAARYGTSREAAIIWHDKEVRIPPDEFLNLYAISAGSVDIDFSSAAEWTQRIKASIFSGGINPAGLAEELDKLASDSGNLRHVRELRSRWQELKEARVALNILNERKNEILVAERQIESKRKALNDIEGEIARLKKSLEEGERNLEQQELYRRLDDIRSIMERILRYEQASRKIDELKLYREDQSTQIAALQAELLETKRRVEDAARLLEQCEVQRSEIALRQKENRAKSERMRNKSMLASELLQRIEANSPREIVTYEVQWNPAGIAVIIASIILGVLLFLYMYPSVLSLAPLAGALVVSSIAAFLARKKREVRQRSDSAPFCATLKDEWKIRIGEELTSVTLEGLQRELVRIQSEGDFLEKEIAELMKRDAEIAGKITEALREKKKSEDAHEVVRQRIEDLFCSLKIGSSEEYASRRAEYNTVHGIFEDLSNKIAHDMKRYAVATLEELKAVCQLRQSTLEKECVSEKKSENEINRLKNEVARNREQLNQLQAKYMAIKSDIDRGKGEVKGALGDLPQNIYEKEKEIETLEKDIRRIELDMQAAAFARDIFLEISEDVNVVFSELENDIGQFLDDILEGERKIQFRDFDKSSIAITDASGSMRSIEGLSTGTRDAFVLAVRFSFALRSWRFSHPGFLVLDEPFHALDKARIARTVELIKRFHQEHGWQIVVFTKDEDLARELAYARENAALHTLGV